MVHSRYRGTMDLASSGRPCDGFAPENLIRVAKIPSPPMAAYDFLSIRLFVDAPFEAGTSLPLDKTQQNYLGNVLRLRAGQRILVFNGRDGEFAAAVTVEGKRVGLSVEAQTRPQTPLPSLRWLFAPLKHARLDYM